MYNALRCYLIVSTHVIFWARYLGARLSRLKVASVLSA